AVSAPVGGTCTWADVVALARADGSWEELEASTRRGLAALRDAAATDRRPSQDEVTEAARRFRYAHDLLAGEELNAWLEQRQVTLAEWRAYVERDIVRGRTSTEEPVVEGEVGEAVWAEAVWAEAVCSGFLE